VVLAPEEVPGRTVHMVGEARREHEMKCVFLLLKMDLNDANERRTMLARNRK